MLEEKYKKEETSIQKFFNGKNIFITGATGFMGKVLLETLLRSCPNVGKIYLLIRNKKNKTIEERLQELHKCEIFNSGYLPKNWQSHIHLVQGNLGSPLLDINKEDLKIIVENVNIVFHCAATVRFNESLKTALSINVLGTAEVLKLCKIIQNLQAVVHVSTAYSNCNRKKIDEKFYPGNISPDEALSLLKLEDDFTLNILEKKLLDNWPNTYTYTKAIAENLVKSHGSELPITIVRPSIVIGNSKSSPNPGFIDNVFGPSGIILGVGLGIVRTLHMDMDVPIDIVPADMCINGMIAAAWHVSSKRYEEPIIFNFTQSENNLLTMGEFINLTSYYGSKSPTGQAIWRPLLIGVKVPLLHSLLRFLMHVLPAIILDILAKVFGQEPRLLKTYRKIHNGLDIISIFVRSEWKFSSNNMFALFNSMSLEDQEIFYTDLRSMDWKETIIIMIDGLKLYLLKEPVKHTPEVKRKLARLKFYHYTLVTFLSAVGIYIAYVLGKYIILSQFTGMVW